MIKSIDYVEDGVRLAFEGKITSQEILDANMKIINHDGFASIRYQLWMFSSVEDFMLSTNDMMNLAEQDQAASEKNQNVKVAIVSDSPLVYGLGRMYEAFSGDNPWEIMIFYELKEAQEWLNLT